MTTLFDSEAEPDRISFFRRHNRAITIVILSLSVLALVAAGFYLTWPKLSYRIWGLRNGMTVNQVIAALGKPTYRLTCDETLCINEDQSHTTAGGENCAATLDKVHLLVLFGKLETKVSSDKYMNLSIDEVIGPPLPPQYRLDLDQTPCATGHLRHYTSKGDSWPHTSLLYIWKPDTVRTIEFDANGRMPEQTILQYRGPLPENRALNLAAFGLTAGQAMSDHPKAFSFPGCSANFMVTWRPETPGPQQPDDIYYNFIETAFDRYRCTDTWHLKRAELYPGFDWPSTPGAHAPSEDFLVLESRSFGVAPNDNSKLHSTSCAQKADQVL